MKSAAKSGAQMRQAGGISVPFIGLNVPFVCRSQPRVRPFICHKAPSVKFTAFYAATRVARTKTLVGTDVLLAWTTASVTGKCSKRRATPVRREP